MKGSHEALSKDKGIGKTDNAEKGFGNNSPAGENFNKIIAAKSFGSKSEQEGDAPPRPPRKDTNNSKHGNSNSAGKEERGSSATEQDFTNDFPKSSHGAHSAKRGIFTPVSEPPI